MIAAGKPMTHLALGFSSKIVFSHPKIAAAIQTSNTNSSDPTIDCFDDITQPTRSPNNKTRKGT
jgi:hypothetical protein